MSVEAAVICLIDREVVMTSVSRDLEANQGEGVQLMSCLEKRVLVALNIAAQLDPAEVLGQVLQAHEEGTIVLV